VLIGLKDTLVVQCPLLSFVLLRVIQTLKEWLESDSERHTQTTPLRTLYDNGTTVNIETPQLLT
jgi:hypothetical protein